MAKPHLTASRLRELLHYFPETGQFVRIARRNGKACWSPRAPLKNAKSYYLSITVDRYSYPEHRLVWLYMTGEWPTNQIDHINGNGRDNRFANLRDVSGAINSQNVKRPRKHNSLGVLGVRQIYGGWFEASIRVNGKTKKLGNFLTAPSDNKPWRNGFLGA